MGGKPIPLSSFAMDSTNDEDTSLRIRRFRGTSPDGSMVIGSVMPLGDRYSREHPPQPLQALVLARHPLGRHKQYLLVFLPGEFDGNTFVDLPMQSEGSV
jgi:hypothetical protein